MFGQRLESASVDQESPKEEFGPQEHTVHMGLQLITLSDLLFCVTILPSVVMNQHQVVYEHPFSFHLVYNVYCIGVLTIFSLLSTWFIVATAGIRYLGICHSQGSLHHPPKNHDCPFRLPHNRLFLSQSTVILDREYCERLHKRLSTSLNRSGNVQPRNISRNDFRDRKIHHRSCSTLLEHKKFCVVPTIQSWNGPSKLVTNLYQPIQTADILNYEMHASL